jgi:diguanylate cyclase (GGDEF)-like protein/PAS domain S-box-containing protein
MRVSTASSAAPAQPAPVAASLLPAWGWWILLALALCGTAVSFGAWYLTASTEREANRTRFERRVQDTTAELQFRLDDTVRLVRSASALFAASDRVRFDEWRAFVDSQDLEQSFPGLMGLGYAPLVRAPELIAFQDATQRELGSEFHVWPPGARERYAPVLYRAPMDALYRRALGYDLLNEAARRQTLDAAATTGQPTLSAIITLIHGSKSTQPVRGALLVMPIYRHHSALTSAAQRQAAVEGWVYAPMDLAQVASGVVQRSHNELSLSLWEDSAGAASTLIYAEAENASTTRRPRPTFETDLPLSFAGRHWRVHVATRPAFDAGQTAHGATAILSGGLAITLLVTLLTGTLLNMRGRALRLAEHLSSAYRASELRVRTVLDNAAEGIVTADFSGRLLSANGTARRLLDLPAGSLPETWLQQLLPLDLEAWNTEPESGPRAWRQQVTRTREDGSTRTLMLAASDVRLDDGARCFVVLLSDLTELEAERLRADDAHRLNETILSNAPFCVIATDRAGRVRSVNGNGERLLGYAPDELVGRDAVSTVLLPEELGRLASQLSLELGRPVNPASVLAVRALRQQRDELECTFLRKDGTHVPVVMALAPLMDRAGELSGFLGIAYDITERKRSEAYIRHMAHHDELTGLPNRTLLQERAAFAIEQAQRGKRQIAVLLIDLDRFKQINDSLGHHAGDVVLCTVAARLKHCVRSSDTVARMGGDEFVILLPNIESAEQAERIAAKLLNAMVEPVQAGPHRLTVTPSIGIACYPQDGEDLGTLLRNADTAMYHCKSGGRNSYTLYTPQMHTASAKRLELEGDLRLALERSELQLHYQPLVSLEDGRAVGVEALLRWTHPSRGPISPVDFIPIAEDTGLIVPIGEWVLRTACADMKRVLQLTGQRLKVAVNLSPRQLRTANLTTVISDALNRAGWAAEDLELEITESMVIENPDASIAAMQRLRAMGVGMAIDDFGTGYSSLSYLTRFPVAKLKLDRSFVRGLPHDERDAAIATSVVAMGHGLKLQVLAEGVETEAQMLFLRQLGCQMGQGWLFAKAMPLEALVRYLQADAPAAVAA